MERVLRSLASGRWALVLLLGISASSVLAEATSDRVPVLVWTNDPSVTFPQHSVGHSVSRHEFHKSYVKDLTSGNRDNVVLFMQDKLSVSDFTHFSDAFNTDDEKNSFKHIKSLISEMSSTFLPSVSSPSSVLMEVKNLVARKVKIIDDPDDILFESDDEPHLIIVRLPESHHSYKSFSRLDNMIGIVSLQLKALTRPFIAFYTAAHSSQVFSPQSHRQSRRLMDDGGAMSEIFVNVSDMFYFYAENLTISINTTSSTISSFIPDEKNAECNMTGGCVVVLKFANISEMNLYSPQLRFEFNITKDDFWYLSLFALEYAITKDGEMRSDEYATDFVDQTPLGFSYHCGNLPAIPPKNTSGSQSAPSIQFHNFQIQAFVQIGGQFGHYNDCVGFFTVGTWMFLISTAIMIAILFFGIIMLLNVSTQDRFDDAKGKTISVSPAEG